MAEFKAGDLGINPGGDPHQNRVMAQSALDGALSAGGDLIFPGASQPYDFDDQVIPRANNITVRGDGGDTVLRTTSPTANLFAPVGTPSSPIYNFTLRDIALGASVRKTSGAALFARYSARTVIENVLADKREESAWNLYDGFHFDRFDDVDVDRATLDAHHWGLAANGENGGGWGADLYVHGGSKITNAAVPNNLASDSIGIYLGGSVGGFTVTDTDIIYCGRGVVIDTGLTGTANDQIFFNPGAFVDSCGWDGIDIGPNGCTTFQATGLWIASHGIISGGFTGGNGINVQPGQSPICSIIFTGGSIFNNRGTGASFNGGEITMRGTKVSDNGQDRSTGGDGVGIYSSSVAADIDVHATRNGIGSPNSRGAGLYIAGGVKNGRFAGRYWANGHYNINDQSGNNTNNKSGAMA